MTDALAIPLTKLIAWEGNVRKTEPAKNVKSLAASIKAHGLLQSLTVRKDKRGKYAVIAGRRRLLALRELAEEGAISKDALIPCLALNGQSAAGEIGLAENVAREDMHPADEFEAFQTLVESGSSAAEVAARFGLTEKLVRQRLKLANVSPVILRAYRQGEMTLEHVMAFAVTDDHAAQEQVWRELPEWRRGDAGAIRDLLTEDEITASDARVRFVTIEAYQSAGGALRRDLFSEGEDGVFVEDLPLLEQLAAAKLERLAAQVREEGWAWVEVRAFFEYAEWAAFKRLRAEPLPLDAERQAELDALNEELEGLAELDELDEAQAARSDEVNARIDAINDRAAHWTEEALRIAGAVVAINRAGEADIRRGLVKAQDLPRKTRRAKEGGAGTEQKPQGLSASLVESLTGERSAALTACLINRPDIALAATVHALAAGIFYDGAGERGALQIEAAAQSLHRAEGSRACETVGAAGEAWTALLPADHASLFAWCIAQPQDVVLRLLSFCAAQTIDAVQLRQDDPGGSRLLHAGLLAEALGLNMGDWFATDAGNYFGRVSKAAIIEALREVKGREAPAWRSMKKGELCALAERETASSGWLPAPLRALAPLVNRAA